MNIIVSGWPAAGGSTTALLLSLSLGYKYMYAGGLLKYLAGELGFGTDGHGLMDFEAKVGNEWDKIWEAFREWKLTNSDRIVLDSKIGGFLQPPSDNIYSIMLTADLEARYKHSQSDKRTIAPEEIARRDKQVGDRWRSELGIDLYSQSEIQKHYQLCVDNTSLTIQQTLEAIYNALSHHPEFAKAHFFPKLVSEIEGLVKNFEQGGKPWIKQQIESKGLLLEPQDLLAEIKQNLGIDLLENLRGLAGKIA